MQCKFQRNPSRIEGGDSFLVVLMEENTKNTDRRTKKLSSLSVLIQIVSNFHCIYPNAFIRAHRDRFLNFDVVQLLQSFYSSHQWLCPLDAYGCGLSYEIELRERDRDGVAQEDGAHGRMASLKATRRRARACIRCCHQSGKE
jgi:hypothetical protein